MRTPSTSTAPATARQIEPIHAQVWRASSLGACVKPCVPSGFHTLDAELPGGGWPTGGLSEILMAPFALLEWRLLGPALKPLLAEPIEAARAGRPGTAAGCAMLLINPPHTPHLPGLQACGLPAKQLIWIEAGTQQQRLWTIEQAIKSNAAAAILAWLPEARPEQIRRLQCCAQGANAPIFLFRPLQERAQSSAAPLRLALSHGADWCLQVQILKRRGPVHGGVLSLPALPAGLAQVLTPTMPARAQLASPPPAAVESHDHALARPAVLARAH